MYRVSYCIPSLNCLPAVIGDKDSYFCVHFKVIQITPVTVRIVEHVAELELTESVNEPSPLASLQINMVHL